MTAINSNGAIRPVSPMPSSKDPVAPITSSSCCLSSILPECLVRLIEAICAFICSFFSRSDSAAPSMPTSASPIATASLVATDAGDLAETSTAASTSSPSLTLISSTPTHVTPITAASLEVQTSASVTATGAAASTAGEAPTIASTSMTSSSSLSPSSSVATTTTIVAETPPSPPAANTSSSSSSSSGSSKLSFPPGYIGVWGPESMCISVARIIHQKIDYKLRAGITLLIADFRKVRIDWSGLAGKVNAIIPASSSSGSSKKTEGAVSHVLIFVKRNEIDQKAVKSECAFSPGVRCFTLQGNIIGDAETLIPFGADDTLNNMTITTLRARYSRPL